MRSLPHNVTDLLRAPLALSSEATITSIGGGAINKVFRLKDGTRQFAVKWIGDDSFSGVNRMHQYAIQEQLANRGIAPHPIWLDDDGRLWVEEWHDVELPNTEHNVGLLAQCLSQVHQLPITARTLNLSERWSHYATFAALPRHHELTDAIAQWRPTANRLMNQDEDMCFCHNDLSYGHILARDPFTIVDWEYASMGNRYFDIVACCMINELSSSETQTLCEHYASALGLDADTVKEGVSRFVPIVDLTYKLWTEALKANSSDDEGKTTENGLIG